MEFVIILKGVSCSGKSSFAKMLKEQMPDLVILSADKIAKEEFGIINKPNTQEVYDKLTTYYISAVKNNKSILIDATTTKNEYELHYLKLLEEYAKTEYLTIFVNFYLRPKEINKNINKKQKTEWSHMTIDQIKSVVNKQKKEYEKPLQEKYNMVLDIFENYQRLKVVDFIAMYYKLCNNKL